MILIVVMFEYCCMIEYWVKYNAIYIYIMKLHKNEKE